MSGETNLSVLLRSMTPVLHDESYGFVSTAGMSPVAPNDAFAIIREEEGTTIVASSSVLAQAQLTPSSAWARITLQIHSSLEAVGLTARFATALGNKGISANVIAGHYHDHIFVQWDKRHAAIDALTALSRSS